MSVFIYFIYSPPHRLRIVQPYVRRSNSNSQYQLSNIVWLSPYRERGNGGIRVNTRVCTSTVLDRARALLRVKGYRAEP